MPSRAVTWQLRTYATSSIAHRQCGQSPARQSVPPPPGCSPARSSASATESPAANGTAAPSTVSAPAGASAAPDVTEREPFGERVGRVEHVLREAGDPGLAGDRRHHRGAPADGGLLHQPALEDGAEDALMQERLADRELPLRVEAGHAGAGAGAAGRAVDGAGPGGGTVPVELARRDGDDIAPRQARVRRRRVQLADRD